VWRAANPAARRHASARAPLRVAARALIGETYERVLRLMLIRLSDRSLADDVCAHFTRSGFTCNPAGGSMVDVTRPDAPTSGQERREIEFHLRVWRATNPDSLVDVIPA
jgi:hypothetical protein